MLPALPLAFSSPKCLIVCEGVAQTSPWFPSGSDTAGPYKHAWLLLNMPTFLVPLGEGKLRGARNPCLSWKTIGRVSQPLIPSLFLPLPLAVLYMEFPSLQAIFRNVIPFGFPTAL